MKNYVKNWDFMRFVRLVIGVVITVQGVVVGQWLIVGVGALFTLLPLFNVSTCGTGGCEVPRKRNIRD